MKKIAVVFFTVFIILSVITVAFAEEGMIFSLSSAQSKPGEDVTLSVSVKKNPGFAGFVFNITYDPTILTPQSVEGNDELRGQFIENMNYNKTTIRVIFANARSHKADGELFSITFKVVPTITGEITSGVGLTLESISNEKLQSIQADVIAGSVSITGSIEPDDTKSQDTPDSSEDTELPANKQDPLDNKTDPSGNTKQPEGGAGVSNASIPPADKGEAGLGGESGSLTENGSVNNELTQSEKLLTTGSRVTAEPIGDPYAFVPFYSKNDGVEAVVSMSAVIDGVLVHYKREGVIYSYRDNSKAFNDVSDHWAKNDITFVTARELFGGVGDERFDPNGSMTRAMLVTVLGRLCDAEVAGQTSSFSDVNKSVWYSPYVAWASENGIVNGIGNNRFDPDTPVTREETSVIIVKFGQFMDCKPKQITEEMKFMDVESISAWAIDAVAEVQKAGIMNGKEQFLFDPKGSTTRAEMSAILRRFIENLVGE